MHPHIRLPPDTGKNYLRGMRGRANSLADTHHRIRRLRESHGFHHPRARPAARAVPAARKILCAVAALLARAKNHHIHIRRPPRHRHSEAKMRTVIRAPVPLRVAIKGVDFLPIRRGENLLVTHPHAGYAQLLAILRHVDDLAFITADINRHYSPSTTKVT